MAFDLPHIQLKPHRALHSTAPFHVYTPWPEQVVLTKPRSFSDAPTKKCATNGAHNDTQSQAHSGRTFTSHVNAALLSPQPRKSRKGLCIIFHYTNFVLKPCKILKLCPVKIKARVLLSLFANRKWLSQIQSLPRVLLTARLSPLPTSIQFHEIFDTDLYL